MITVMLACTAAALLAVFASGRAGQQLVVVALYFLAADGTHQLEAPLIRPAVGDHSILRDPLRGALNSLAAAAQKLDASTAPQVQRSKRSKLYKSTSRIRGNP